MIEPEALHFLALGGSGEIGMNFNLYGCRGSWIMVDLGVTFADDTLPGIELVLPDPAFIEAERENLLGIILTHAHEDHIGAVGALWPRLQCPVYATPFTAEILKSKLYEAGILDEVPLHIVPMGGRVTLGPFDAEFVALTHSIPEPNALRIKTPFGTVMHTGDWKLDPDPLIGEPVDAEALTRIGEEGVRAIVCNSTNVFYPGHSGSEAEIEASLEAIDRAAQGPGRGDDLRVQRRADQYGLQGRGQARPACRAGRPVDAAGGRGGAGDRPSRSDVPADVAGRRRVAAARQGALSLHRQPGRAARRHEPHCHRRIPRRGAGRGRYGDLFVQDHSGQRESRLAASTISWPIAVSKSSPRRTNLSMSPAIPTATS